MGHEWRLHRHDDLSRRDGAWEDTEALDEDSDAWLDDMAPDEDAHWDEGE